MQEDNSYAKKGVKRLSKHLQARDRKREADYLKFLYLRAFGYNRADTSRRLRISVRKVDQFIRRLKEDESRCDCCGQVIIY